MDYKNESVWLMKGDCLERMKEIPSGSVDAIICDPPFNIVEKIGKNIHIFRQASRQIEPSITEKSMSFDVGFDQISWLGIAIEKLKAGGNMIIFNDWENMGDIAKEARAHKMKVKCLCHWQKPNPTPVEWKRRFVAGREYFIHLSKGGKNTFNTEALNFGSFTVPLTPKSEKSSGKHPNQKPIKLMQQLVEILTNHGDSILDPFMGSGSTGVACANTGREFIGIELDRDYFNICVNRMKGVFCEQQLDV